MLSTRLSILENSVALFYLGLTMRHRTLLVFLLGSIAAGLTSASVDAQQRDFFLDPENLQVLPGDISPSELDSQMRRFKLALGVECSHCHVGTDDRRLTDFDFPSDAKEPKRVAREMLRMVAAINGMVSSINRGPGHQVVAVACVTCHRGHFRPVMIKDVLATYSLRYGVHISAGGSARISRRCLSEVT